MKRFMAILASATLFICLLSCSHRGTYDDGYEDGYNDGYSDAEFEMEYLMEEEFFDGYDIGFDDGYDIGFDDGYGEVYNAIEDASDYAREQTGWSVYEAWSNISIYKEGVHPYGYGLPTEEEYLQSIETLVLFCKHLDSSGFGG